MKRKLLVCALQILLVGTLMLSGAIRDTGDFRTAAVHILTAGTLLNALWYCLASGSFFFPLQIGAAVTFGFFFLLGELTTYGIAQYFTLWRLFDALGMAAAGASLALSAAALGAILAHLIRTAAEKIRTGHAACPYLWEMLLCFVWITVIYLFPLSVRFTEWDYLIDSDGFLLFVFLAACLCAGVYGFARGRFLLPVLVLTLISGGMGFFTYSYPEVHTTAHVFNFAENVQFFGLLVAVPLTAFGAGIGVLLGRIACAVQDHIDYRKTIQDYNKSE